MLRKVNSTSKKKYMNICIYTVHLFVYECITCKVKSCLSKYCTFHISYVTTKIQNNYKTTSMRKIFFGWTSCRSFWSGQRFSSTSHLMFSIAMHRGKISLNAHISSAMISCDVLTSSIHGIQQRHLILWSMIIFFPPPFSLNGSDCAVGNLHIYAPKLDWLQ